MQAKLRTESFCWGGAGSSLHSVNDDMPCVMGRTVFPRHSEPGETQSGRFVHCIRFYGASGRSRRVGGSTRPSRKPGLDGQVLLGRPGRPGSSRSVYDTIRTNEEGPGPEPTRSCGAGVRARGCPRGSRADGTHALPTDQVPTNTSSARCARAAIAIPRSRRVDGSPPVEIQHPKQGRRGAGQQHPVSMKLYSAGPPLCRRPPVKAPPPCAEDCKLVRTGMFCPTGVAFGTETTHPWVGRHSRNGYLPQSRKDRHLGKLYKHGVRRCLR